jgi:hypothetical protein
LYGWVRRLGLAGETLDWFVDNACSPDIVDLPRRRVPNASCEALADVRAFNEGAVFQFLDVLAGRLHPGAQRTPALLASP